MRVGDTCACRIYMYVPIRAGSESPLYEIPGVSRRLIHVFGRRKEQGKENCENKVARDRGNIARIFAFRGRRDIWKCSSGIVGRERERETEGRKKEHSLEEVGELFILRSGELRRTILSPTKWPGSIFGLPLFSYPYLRIFLPLSLLSSCFLPLFFFSLRTPFSPCVFHEQHKFPPKKSTVQWHASTRSLIFLHPHFLSPSQGRESY